MTAYDKHSSLFAGNFGCLSIEWSPARGYTWINSTFTYKYYTREEVTDSDKHSSLFAGKVRSVPIEYSLVRGSSLA